MNAIIDAIMAITFIFLAVAVMVWAYTSETVALCLIAGAFLAILGILWYKYRKPRCPYNPAIRCSYGPDWCSMCEHEEITW